MLYRLLENPRIYALSQQIVAPGGLKDLTGEIHRLIRILPDCPRMLDVGSGPKSWLWDHSLMPVGFDISFPYCRQYKSRGQPAVVGSAASLPFSTGAFDAVWSVGLLHHLPYHTACQATAEMCRAAGQNGLCVIFDAVLPEPVCRRPLAYFIRRSDRGRFMRRQKEIESMVGDTSQWVFRRISYSWYGLEGLFCIKLPENCSKIFQENLLAYCTR